MRAAVIGDYVGWMERQFVEELRLRLPAHPQLRLGVGDDAAVLRLSQRSDCVVTSDLLADGTHFRLPSDDLRRVGRKALAVNLSDLAAMAAQPVAAIVSLLLPRNGALATARRLYEGMLPLAEEFGVAIAGGDTNCWDGALAISVTAIGETTPAGLLRRDGAKAGDCLLVSGALGGSRLGKHFDFTPRVREALRWQRDFDLHAGIDISDGLAIDLRRLCEASNCGAEVELANVPVSAAAERWAAMSETRLSPLEHALSDGEDFELLLAAPPAVAQVMLREQTAADGRLTQIGHITAERGIRGRDAANNLHDLPTAGYEHGTPN